MKKWVKAVIFVVAVLLIVGLIGLGCIYLSGKNMTTARCLVTENGALYMVYGKDERPIRLGYEHTEKFQTGDKLFIVFDRAFCETYPEKTTARFIVKLKSGTAADVPQHIFAILDSLRAD